MINNISWRIKVLPLLLLLGIAAFNSSCRKKNTQSFSGAYKPAVKNFVKFVRGLPTPSEGGIGTKVAFKLEGLDSLVGIDPSKIQFYLNGQPAVIDEITPQDSTILITVPDYASSGAASIVINNKTFFGPEFRVIGDVYIDYTFNGYIDQQGVPRLKAGANAAIRDMYYEVYGAEKNLYIIGDFTTYSGNSTYLAERPDLGIEVSSNVRYLLQLNPDDGQIRTEFIKEQGPNGRLNGMVKLNEFPGFLIYGGFNSYNRKVGINNMTRIYNNGKLDTTVKNVYNPNPQETQYNIDTLPTFVGGFDNTIIKSFLDNQGRIVSIGSFNNYYFNNYDLSTYRNVYRSATYMKHIGAQSQDGILDQTYNFDPTRGQLNVGANGAIADAVQLSNGQIIVVGSFTTFNNKSANRIFRLDNQGQPDPAFVAGTNGPITKITYNPVTRRILLVGTFTEYNGQPATYGLVMIDETGAADNSFVVGEFERSGVNLGQLINYAGQMDDGSVILSGNFEKYKGSTNAGLVRRQGFMILDSRGELIPNLNSTGAFRGIINDIQESTTPGGKKAVIIAGAFNLFDNENVQNIARVALQR